ncbi:MAG: universal stress protein [Bacillota bacterium]|uniref:universal stress protein n=1 Tax=unclassified Virgibacillus TaxID=2620237 RepID=UPI000EF47BE7|nr:MULTISPECIES: universal stress protein [unclassified Virgibacillus]MCC2251826.1 universal stress protein [Virgibacillus sp. AGTR]MDY7044828.1 universal stress protein [Virgibacillus sp. M23]QRZ16306.1 universal stress protein [Virgibacillus sp. AGTR]
MFQKILLAADGSEHSVRSAKQAIELAEKFSSLVEVVYVIDGQTAKADVLHATDKLEIEKKRKEKLKVVENLLIAAEIEYDIAILHGEPGPTIVSYANDNAFDCVVIGSRGLNNLQTFILGSVSHKVAKRVNCPVMIVK